MGPYGSVGAHIKTGRSPVAHDHFQTPPDPQKGYNNPISVLFLVQQIEIWSETGPHGSVGAHIKTGESSMAQDHFKTPPDPKKGHGMTKNPQKNKNILELAKAIHPWW